MFNTDVNLETNMNEQALNVSRKYSFAGKADSSSY